MAQLKQAHALALLLVVLIAAIPHVSSQLVPKDTGRKCSPGQYDNGNFCEWCPSGKINTNSGAFQCEPCAPGQFTNEVHTNCMDECRAASFINEREECQYCGRQGFTTKPNSRSCEKCSPPSFSDFTLCLTCMNDSAAEEDGDGKICGGCGPGSTLHRTPHYPYSECGPCPEGSGDTRTGNTSRNCNPCPPGTFAEYGETFYARVCKKCRYGTFSATGGKDTCTPCPLGSITSEDGSACIADCLPGTPPCNPCPPGMERIPNGKRGCRKCPAGTVNPLNSMTPCSRCIDQRVPNKRRDTCVCSGNQFGVPSGCSRCNKGSKRVDGECLCSDGKVFVDQKCVCKPGEKADGEKCVPCNKAEVTSSKSKCSKCARNEFFDFSKRMCVACPDGTVQDRPSLIGKCQDCITTFKNPYGRTKCGCPPGSSWVVDKCVKCPIGTAIQASTCEPCGGLYYSDEEGLPACKECPIGARYSKKKKQTSCPEKCGPNMRIEDNSNVGFRCVCIDDSINTGTSKKPKCEKCPTGTTSYNSGPYSCRCLKDGYALKGSKCVQCPVGTFATNTECVQCNENTIPSPVGGLCERCLRGTYSFVPGSTKCIACPENQFVTRKSTCDQCPPGFRLRNWECVKCLDNHVSSGGNMAYCMPCKGKTVPNGDSSKCITTET